MLVAAVVALASAALALPADTTHAVVGRQDMQAVVDELEFGMSLPDFMARRDKKDPPNLDWSSDGCTKAPDNPFGFPFLPGCNRHDFGYQNFRAQGRFTTDNKNRIDGQLKTDLYAQCASQGAVAACERLADVYYMAVQEFGGRDSQKREAARSEAYTQAVLAYEEAVDRAQADGLLPAHGTR